MSKDSVYARREETVADFNFGSDIAAVFDDMLNRSIPLYNELQRMIGEIAGGFAREGTNVYDLGCSTGLTMLTLGESIEKPVTIIGVDFSQPMLDKCRKNLENNGFTKPYDLLCKDLNDGCPMQNASVVVLNLTLQFVRPPQRDLLMQQIFECLNHAGCLILVEKVLGNDSVVDRIFIDLYHEMKKRNGYSDLEIVQKREALKNVLIPFRTAENEQLLRRHGFRHIDIFYKWYNFCGLIAVKQ